MDKILIRDLQVDCIIGVNPCERKALQRITLNLELECDLSRASLSDDITDTLDYVTLRDDLFRVVSESRCFLIERLAGLVAERCLDVPMVRTVRVTLDKTGALSGARSVGVSLLKSKRPSGRRVRTPSGPTA